MFCDTDHIASCTQEAEQRQAQEHALAQSSGIECGVCLDVVLEKSAINDRRFGLLCMHMVL